MKAPLQISGALTPRQFELALEYISTTSAEPIRDEFVLWLAVFSGLRAHEIASLPLKELIDDQGRIRDQISLDRQMTKYAPAREVRINQRVKEAVIRFRAVYPEAVRLKDTLGEHASSNVRRWLHAAYEAIGYLEGSTKIRLRHTARMTNGLQPSSTPDKGRRPSFRNADIVRAVRAAQRAGLEVTASEFTADGAIRLSHAPPTPTSASAYDEWKERRDARRT